MTYLMFRILQKPCLIVIISNTFVVGFQSFVQRYICIYSCLQTFESLIYISIYIYGVQCGKALILENIPGCKEIINM